MQYAILSFLQEHHNAVFDALANILSSLGEQGLFILFIIIIYYGLDKKKGFAVFSSMTLTLCVNNTIKAIVRYPRPYMVHEELAGGRLSTATGYSFPSGHTSGAASFYVAIGTAFKNRGLTVAAVILSVLVACSRLYFAVHWPLDVLAGFILGLISAFILVPFLVRKYDDEDFRTKWTGITGLISLVVSVILAIALTLGADDRAFSDLMKMFAVVAGGYGGCLLEWRNIKFAPVRSVKHIVINTLLSIAGVALIMTGLSAIFKGAAYYAGAFIRYGLMGLFVTFIYPAIAVKLGLLKNEKD